MEKLTPPTGLTKEKLREWINININDDIMGFDGVEGIPENEIEKYEYNKLELPKTLKTTSNNNDLSIIQYLTEINLRDSNRTDSDIQWIVLHYTTGKGDTARGNCAYFHDYYVGASANYFIDENYIYQSVLDNDIAWHCGTNGSYYCECRNSNSIGIEMCSDYKDDKYYISDDTVKNTIELVKYLMKKYNIDIDHVIMHYHVTHKNCVAPWLDDISLWYDFKNKLKEDDNMFTDVPNEMPQKTSIERMVKNGIMFGNTDGTFGVGKLITKEDFAVVIDRILQKLSWYQK